MKQCRQCGKRFKPLRETQEDCSELCLANRFDTYVRKTIRLARILAMTMGYRSMSEVRFAAHLKSARVPFKYEAEKLRYRYEEQNYVIDFSVKLPHRNSSPIHLEYKGKLDAQTRRKMAAVKKCNPDVDLRLVFERPNNKLYKGAKMRYWEWAERHGFKWYDVKNIDGIKKDLEDAKKKPKKTKEVLE